MSGCIQNPSSHLRQILADYKSPRFDYLPSFTGGLVGYFSFDYLGYSEPSVRCRVENTEDFKDVDLMLFDKVIAFDHLRQKIILIVNMPLDDVEVGYVAPEKAAQLRQLLAPGIQAVGVFVREAPQSVASLLNSNVIDNHRQNLRLCQGTAPGCNGAHGFYDLCQCGILLRWGTLPLQV